MTNKEIKAKMRLYKIPQWEIAKLFGVAPITINRWLIDDLAELPEEKQKIIQSFIEERNNIPKCTSNELNVIETTEGWMYFNKEEYKIFKLGLAVGRKEAITELLSKCEEYNYVCNSKEFAKVIKKQLEEQK